MEPPGAAWARGKEHGEEGAQLQVGGELTPGLSGSW